tara:strand:- start:861 stop:1439 length:579 start_codon:yes stop_codon:yes gene_type:complete
MANVKETVSKIQRVDGEKQIVYGVVYSPLEIDTWGETMTAEDIEVMAHRFMELQHNQTIDEMHDESPKLTCWPVESFIARKGDPDYPEGAWVLGVKINDDDTWAKVKKGEINGFSFQAMVSKIAAVVEIEFDPEVIGQTEENEGHRHLFFAKIDDDGKVYGGRTTTDAGHSHEIKRGTATEETNGHRHRYFL